MLLVVGEGLNENDSAEENSTIQDDVGLTFNPVTDLVTSRGGGDDVGSRRIISPRSANGVETGGQGASRGKDGMKNHGTTCIVTGHFIGSKICFLVFLSPWGRGMSKTMFG